MKAEADVATAGMKAFGNVKGTQIKGAYELEAYKTKLDQHKRVHAWLARLGALGGFKMPGKKSKFVRATGDKQIETDQQA